MKNFLLAIIVCVGMATCANAQVQVPNLHITVVPQYDTAWRPLRYRRVLRYRYVPTYSYPYYGGYGTYYRGYPRYYYPRSYYPIW